MNRDVLLPSPPPVAAQGRLVAVVVWGYRLVLGRDPESDEVVANWVSLGDPQAVLRHLARSGEAAEAAATDRPPLGAWPAEGISAEAVDAAWLLLKGVPPTPEEVETIIALCPVGAMLREAFLASPEYEAMRDGTEPAFPPAGAVPSNVPERTPPSAPVPVAAALDLAPLHSVVTEPVALPAWGETAVVLDGRRLVIRGNTEDAYWRELHHGVPEASVTSLLRVTRAHLPDGGRGAVLLDAGANIGLASLAMALAAPDHAVLLAVEPDAANARHLRDNLRLNGLPRARVEEMALGARAGMAQFRADDGNSATGHLVGAPSATEGAGRSVTSVPVQRLDRLLAEHGCERLDVLKVDVEGGEDAVLGAVACLSATGHWCTSNSTSGPSWPWPAPIPAACWRVGPHPSRTSWPSAMMATPGRWRTRRC